MEHLHQNCKNNSIIQMTTKTIKNNQDLRFNKIIHHRTDLMSKNTRNKAECMKIIKSMNRRGKIRHKKNSED